MVHEIKLDDAILFGHLLVHMSPFYFTQIVQPYTNSPDMHRKINFTKIIKQKSNKIQQTPKKNIVEFKIR